MWWLIHMHINESQCFTLQMLLDSCDPHWTQWSMQIKIALTVLIDPQISHFHDALFAIINSNSIEMCMLWIYAIVINCCMHNFFLIGFKRFMFTCAMRIGSMELHFIWLIHHIVSPMISCVHPPRQICLHPQCEYCLHPLCESTLTLAYWLVHATHIARDDWFT